MTKTKKPEGFKESRRSNMSKNDLTVRETEIHDKVIALTEKFHEDLLAIQKTLVNNDGKNQDENSEGIAALVMVQPYTYNPKAHATKCYGVSTGVICGHDPFSVLKPIMGEFFTTNRATLELFSHLKDDVAENAGDTILHDLHDKLGDMLKSMGRK